MILVTYNHALRASETLAIVRDDLRSGHLDVRRLKGSLRTIQPLVEHSNPLLSERAALLEHSRSLLNTQRLFPISRSAFWRLMQRHCATAGIPEHKRHPHALKHTRCALSMANKAGIENVRQVAGHKSIASTGAYLRVSDSAAFAAVTAALKG